MTGGSRVGGRGGLSSVLANPGKAQRNMSFSPLAGRAEAFGREDWH